MGDALCAASCRRCLFMPAWCSLRSTAATSSHRASGNQRYALVFRCESLPRSLPVLSNCTPVLTPAHYRHPTLSPGHYSQSLRASGPNVAGAHVICTPGASLVSALIPVRLRDSWSAAYRRELCIRLFLAGSSRPPTQCWIQSPVAYPRKVAPQRGLI